MQLELFVRFFAISCLSFYEYCYQDVLKLDDDVNCLGCQHIITYTDFKWIIDTVVALQTWVK